MSLSPSQPRSRANCKATDTRPPKMSCRSSMKRWLLSMLGNLQPIRRSRPPLRNSAKDERSAYRPMWRGSTGLSSNHWRQELGRHKIDQPHAVVGAIEHEALPVHAKGIDREDDRLAMSLTDALRRGFVEGQMHLLSLLWL